MRHHDEQTRKDPESTGPHPGPASSAGTGLDGHGRERPDRGPEDALDERGSFDRDPPAIRNGAPERQDGAQPDREQPEFHWPAPLPTVFGATTVGDAVAASAMASDRPADERDPRQEDTTEPGDGVALDRTGRAGEEAPPAGTGGPRYEAVGSGPGTAGLLGGDVARDLRERWRRVQLRFIDDPPGAVGDAHQLVEDAVTAVAETLAVRRDELTGGQAGGPDDTERLRVVLRRYRDLLDRLLSM